MAQISIREGDVAGSGEPGATGASGTQRGRGTFPGGQAEWNSH
jgi:hypothetical protein